MVSAVQPLLDRYRDLLARPGEAFPITLGEGATPLVHAARLGGQLGVERLYLKFEGTNPTGSFKDRGMTMAITMAVADGSRAVILWNRGSEASTLSATWETIGLFPGTRARVRDLWQHADLGSLAERVQAKVAPHGVVMLRVTPQP